MKNKAGNKKRMQGNFGVGKVIDFLRVATSDAQVHVYGRCSFRFVSAFPHSRFTKCKQTNCQFFVCAATWRSFKSEKFDEYVNKLIM